MRTTIDLPDHLARQVKAVAALRGMKFKELISGFVEQGLLQLAVQSQPPPRSKLPAFKKAVGGGPVPSLSNAEIQDILDKEDAKRL